MSCRKNQHHKKKACAIFCTRCDVRCRSCVTCVTPKRLATKKKKVVSVSPLPTVRLQWPESSNCACASSSSTRRLRSVYQKTNTGLLEMNYTSLPPAERAAACSRAGIKRGDVKATLSAPVSDACAVFPYSYHR